MRLSQESLRVSTKLAGSRRRWGGAAEFWTGARIERRGSELWVHERYEAGVMRVGPVRSKPVPSVGEAVRAFVQANGGQAVDGVLIDWGG